MNHGISNEKKGIHFFVSLGVLLPLLLFPAKKVPQNLKPEPGLDLTNIFRDQLVSDTNNDSIPDDISARFLIDSRTTAVDVEAAAAVAARLGFESSAMNPSLCISSREEASKKKIDWLISFAAGKSKTAGKANCGIRIIREKGIHTIEIFGVTSRDRRYAAVNFFSRFPYIWDISGRETGELWSHVRDHIYSQLPESYREKTQVTLRAVHYCCPEPLPEAVRQRRLQRTGLTGTVQKDGEVEQADVELRTPANAKDAAAIFKNLIASHKRGDSTDILNYGGINQVTLHISSTEIEDGETVIIPRSAVPQRFLNPSTDPFFFKKKVSIDDSFSDIAGFYGTSGIYKDSDADGFADRLASRMIYDGVLPHKAVNLGARIGLEDCTVSLPFIIPANDLDMKSIKNLERPILVGSGNRFSDYLFKIGKAKLPEMRPDEGFIQFCPGFNPGGAYIISGSTTAGENAALQFAAAALPFISTEYTEPGAPEWQDVNREIELFFTRENDAGTAAFGILQVDRQKEAFSAPDLQKTETRLYTKRQVQNLDSFISKRIQTYQINTKYSVKTGGRLEAAKGFSDSYSPQWEVDEFREIFTQKVIPELQNLVKEKTMQDTPPALFIDLRLSEPPEVLERQKSWIADMAEEAGFKKESVKIRVITAYKQGFHWIKDDVIPRLKRTAAPAAAIHIRFSSFPADFEETRKYRPEPVRWLQELYPIDEILEKELDIPLDKIHFIKDETLGEAAYELTAFGPEGENLFNERFAPFTTEIPFQSRFRKWGNVVVSSGGIRVRWGSREIFFTALETDPLRLWKHYQEKILPKLTGMIEKQTGGTLKLEDQPFFDKLQISVKMSEPDFRLGLDEELVSSLESFHEDIYFNTLDYFQGLVQKDPEMDVADPLMAQRWASPGNIVPIIHSSRTGQGPQMEAAVTGLESLTTKVEMKFHHLEEKKPVTISTQITPLKKLKGPRLTCIVIDQTLQVKEAVYTLEFANEEELSDAADMLRILRELQQENILVETFSYPGLSSIRFVLTAPQGLESQFVLNPSGAGSRSRHFVPSPGQELSKRELEQALSRIMSPRETLDLARGLGRFPEINHYIGGYSYQGRPVPVLEIGLKSAGKLVSRRKTTTYKPTIFLLGRQHANEVSSTNYGFNIAYLLVKDPGFRKYLEKLNIVIEPMENPDGSALAVKLQELTPHHMLHAGRYSALGTDIGYHVNRPDTLITEAKVRKKLYDRWQPDIFLNNHGYPSHEWVQQFSNYTPYLFRAYWVPRGWYYFHSGLDTIAAPLHKQAGERVVKIISEKMKSDPEVFETNRRIYDRYRRWAERWQPHLHYLELYDGSNIYKKRRGATADRLSKRRQITVLEAVPEAMDETARDEWLQLAIRQGTLFVTSFFDLMIDSLNSIERIEEESGDVVHLQIIRHRPIRVQNE